MVPANVDCVPICCNDDELPPLRALDPENLPAPSLRRSSRFTMSPVRVASENVSKKGGKRSFSATVTDFESEVQTVNYLRRSPRFSPSPQSRGVDFSLKKSRFQMHGNGIRSSPRLLGSSPVPTSSNSKTPSIVSNDQTSKKRRVALSPHSHQAQTANSHCSPSSMYEVVEASDELLLRRSRKIELSQLKPESDCFGSSKQNSCLKNLRYAKNGGFNATKVKMFVAESRELEVKILNFLRDFDVVAEEGLQRLLSLGKNKQEFKFLNGRDTPSLSFSFDDNEKPKPFKFNPRFFMEKRLRRSPRFLAYKNKGDIKFLRKFGLKIMEGRQLELENKISRNFSRSHMSSLGVDCDKISSSNGLADSEIKQSQQSTKISISSVKIQKERKHSSFFVGDPILPREAEKRWNWRYKMKNKSLGRKKLMDDDEEIILDVKCHYAQAKVRGCIFSLGDCAYIKGDAGKNHVGKILEFFKTFAGENYFRVQWFYRVEDTVIQEKGALHDKKCLFYSTLMDDNLIDCLTSKVNVKKLSPRVGLRQKSISSFDYYYDMEYCIDYSTFRGLGFDNSFTDKECTASKSKSVTSEIFSVVTPKVEVKEELALLDLYSGCGGMSTGLCLGAKLSSVNLVTRWAVDGNKSACESLKINHPETHVRNEFAEDFLELLKKWEALCKQYRVKDAERTIMRRSNDLNSNIQVNDLDGEYEVARIVDICYGDPNEIGKCGLNFKVHWKGYGTSEDTWEPLENLRNCENRLNEFIREGLKSRILPLPREVDVICGGPPCQGISGYNRYRNRDNPLADERNRQIVVFMDIVKFLKPKYVLMENVTDILKFDKGSLGRYALSRLVSMNYQSRLGTVAAGCYGLPQFRLRVFLWGAHPEEKLPQFPLPTHDVIVRYWPPLEFERNLVGFDEGQPRLLESLVVLRDAISDLPQVTYQEAREEMPYEVLPETDFQRFIRSTQYEMMGSAEKHLTRTEYPLYDHRPYSVTEDDYLRICAIPKRKGANFRDLPGVVVGHDNVARQDLENQTFLPSGKPMVPHYALTLEKGRSKRPFARLWWDETVPTVLTFPSCRNQAALHPEQDRPLTIREYARLQGFPDYYRFCGTVKERYCQVGNAVAVPVGRALGYCLGMAIRKLGGDEPLITLPPKFSHSNYLQLKESLSLEME